jgi:sugar phosphate permease
MMISNSQRRWMIYLIACLLFNLSQFYRSSIAVISPNLAQDLKLDTQDLGLVSAAFFYAFGVMQVPVGLYLDSIGPRIFMTALSLVAVAGAVVFAWGESAAALVAGRVLLGMGMACNLMGPLKLITSWFSPRYFATLSAVFFSVGTAGNIFAATPLVWLATSIGWRATFVLVAGCNLAISVVFFIIARDVPEDSVPARRSVRVPLVSFPEALGGLWQLFTRRDYWLISMGTFFRYGVYASVQALWAGPFLMLTMGLSQFSAGNILLAMSIGLIVGSPVCGWLSDTMLHSRKRVVIIGLAVMGGALITLGRLPTHAGLWILYLLFIGFGFFSGAGQIMYAHIKERMPIEKAGLAMTGINFFTMTGVAFFLHGLGWAIQKVHRGEILAPEAFRMAFVLFGGCLAAAVLLYSFTVDARGDRVLQKNLDGAALGRDAEP